MTTTPRNEYPRPQFTRKNWQSLNGTWDFSFDTDSFDQQIQVPYVYQSALSGIHSNEAHDVVWYRKQFTLDKEQLNSRLILHFGAVDYTSQLWVNGTYIREHIGGHVGFEAEITDHVIIGENEIILKVVDPVLDLEMPRGKQYWKDDSDGIFYTRSTGIWQSVWLETVPMTFLKKVHFTPDLDNRKVHIRYEVDGNINGLLNIDVTFEGKLIASQVARILSTDGELTIDLNQQVSNVWQTQEGYAWSPEHPRLFDVDFQLSTDDEIDSVSSYFGLRKVSVQDGKFLLNNKPYYQKLLLDQGYWKDSLLTAATDDDFVKDINLAREMGFNGVRKHQKVEDPRFLYHADRLGFLVWGEIAAAYSYSRKYAERITNEWMAAVNRDYNHPSIVVWTPLNESWGVVDINSDKLQQSHSAAMYYLTKSLDSTRLVISNDGWEHTKSDLFTIHDYEGDYDVLADRYKDINSIVSARPAGRALHVGQWAYEGEPILVTEFGGISYQKDEQQGWGYTSATSDEDFAKRYHAVISAILDSPNVCGFCYTQITDVEQEINGLLTYDRAAKIDLSIIRAINENRWTEDN